MVDTVRTLAALQTLLADNDAQAIDPQDLRDFLVSVYPQWQNWTPELTATTTNPTLGTGSEQVGRYTNTAIPGVVLFYGYIRFGTSGTNAGSGLYEVSLPVEAVEVGAAAFLLCYGVGMLRDNNDSAAPKVFILRRSGNTEGSAAQLVYDGDFVDHVSPWSWSSLDGISFLGLVEAA